MTGRMICSVTRLCRYVRQNVGAAGIPRSGERGYRSHSSHLSRKSYSNPILREHLLEHLVMFHAR